MRFALLALALALMLPVAPQALAARPAPPAPAPAHGCAGVRTGSAPTDGIAPARAPFSVPRGFTANAIARVDGARELADLPNGDLLVGTSGNTVEIVPNAEGSRAAGAARTFATLPDAPAAGVAFDRASCTIFVGTQFGVYAIAYADGDLRAGAIARIARVRTRGGGGHSTTSVAVANGTLYVSVGSSCNACVEDDPTRATILTMDRDGSHLTTRARRIRNAMGLAVNPASGHVWVGGAGQDDLPQPHPYEYIDDLSAHAGVADYGWPGCEERHVAYTPGANCSETVSPIVETPAYSTIIGLTFYPADARGAHAFPNAYHGGIFAAHHGSWHTLAASGCNVAPDVIFVPMNGDHPRTPVSWNDPTTQWRPFATRFQPGCFASTRVGRPTGITVGTAGSLFIADDLAGTIYRVRPNAR